MANHRLWHSGVREPRLPRVSIRLLSPQPSEKDRRGQRSREQHNEVREFKDKKGPGSPASQEERKQIFGFYSDNSGRTYTKAQIDAYVRSIRKGEIPTVPLDEKSVVYHPPESERDLIDSVGEIYVPRGKRYPALKIPEGTVLYDPKIQHSDPALK